MYSQKIVFFLMLLLIFYGQYEAQGSINFVYDILRTVKVWVMEQYLFLKNLIVKIYLKTVQYQKLECTFFL